MLTCTQWRCGWGLLQLTMYKTFSNTTRIYLYINLIIIFILCVCVCVKLNPRVSVQIIGINGLSVLQKKILTYKLVQVSK